MVLLNVIFIYMVAGLVFPDFFGEESVDLKENFYAHRRWFFGLGVGTILASVGKDLVLSGKLPDKSNLVFHAIFGLMLLTGAFTSREWYHKALAVLVSALFLLYIVLLYLRMQ